MSVKNASALNKLAIVLTIIGLIAGCNSSDSDSVNSGYIKMYNASPNSPAIQMVINEYTYPEINYAQATNYYELNNDEYMVEVQWQSDEDSSETVEEHVIAISEDITSLVVVNGDFNEPSVMVYQYENESPDEEDNEIYTFRWLNVHSNGESVDVYISKEEETFEQAELVAALAHGSMSDSFYNDLGQYKFYVTLSGETQVLFESDDVNFEYESQYIMVVRDNIGPGDSNFTIDKLAKSASIEEINDYDATAEVRLFNGIDNVESIDLHLSLNPELPIIADIAPGLFSETKALTFGDYSMRLITHDSRQELINNHLLTLSANSDKTVFFYTDYPQSEDEDDESETELPVIRSITVDNSNRISSYDHQINVINFIQEYTTLDIYFVRSSETIETAQYKLTNQKDNVGEIVLPNNTYQVFVTTIVEGSRLLLTQTDLTLNEASGDLFIVTEQVDATASEFSLVVSPQ